MRNDDELLCESWAVALLDGSSRSEDGVSGLLFVTLALFGAAVVFLRDPLSVFGVSGDVMFSPRAVPVWVGYVSLGVCAVWLVLSFLGWLPGFLSLFGARGRSGVERAVVAGLICERYLDANDSPRDVAVRVLADGAPMEFDLHLRKRGFDRKKALEAMRRVSPDLGMLPDSVMVSELGPALWRVKMDDITPAERLSYRAVDWSFDAVPGGGRAFIGEFADGSPCVLDLREDSCLVSGVQGSGKSVCIEAVLASLLSCPCERVVCATTWGKSLDFSEWEGVPGFELCTSAADLLAVLDSMFGEGGEFARRRAYLSRLGRKNMRAAGFSDEFPHITILVDEFANLAMETVPLLDDEGNVRVNRAGEPMTRAVGSEMVERLLAVVREGRAFGVVVVACLQRAEASTIPSKLRDLLTSRVCFRQPSKASYSMGLACKESEVPADIPPFSPDGEPIKGVGYFKVGQYPELFRGALVADVGAVCAALMD